MNVLSRKVEYKVGTNYSLLKYTTNEGGKNNQLSW
jgi:hypothetical protein